MIEYFVLGGWFILSLPVSVFLGKCISFGQAGEAERHATAPAAQEAPPVPMSTGAARSDAPFPEVPAQRRPRGHCASTPAAATTTSSTSGAAQTPLSETRHGLPD